VDTFSMLPQRLQVDDIVQRRRPVSSRMGENLFWLGRYTERTEQLVRLARATLLVIDADSDAAPPVLQACRRWPCAPGWRPGRAHAAQSPHLFERAVLAGLGDGGGAQGSASVAYNLAALERASTGAARAPVVRTLGPDPSHARGLRLGAGHPARRTAQLSQVLPALDRLACSWPR
jgi:hypothetical protein